MKHTPGPWIAVLGTDGRWLVTLADKAGRVVARLWADPESEQNATLIAAARDMLTALMVARDVLVTIPYHDPELCQKMSQVDAAIAKATNTKGGN